MKTLLTVVFCLLLGKLSNITWRGGEVLIRVFKHEKELEVWVHKENRYQLIKTYKVCALSGKFGPKRYEGDLQVPEGIYEVIKLNPHSNYHKSIKINYPNKSDSLLSSYPKKGGEIYIHGKCVSVGCVAIGDVAIDELYNIVNQSPRTSVHIFPARYDIHNEYYRSSLADQPKLRSFETNLAQFYYYFEDNKILPIITVDSTGLYKTVAELK